MARAVVIGGREFTDPLTVRLAQHMTEDRAAFVAVLRSDRECTFREVAEECARAWSKDWGPEQIVGAALCALAAAYFGEDCDWL